MTTTIKVSNQLRDRLKARAGEQGLTIGSYLEHLVRVDERSRQMKALGAAIANTPPELMKSYREELAEWEQAELIDAPYA